jgi:hypothetical protein
MERSSISGARKDNHNHRPDSQTPGMGMGKFEPSGHGWSPFYKKVQHSTSSETISSIVKWWSKMTTAGNGLRLGTPQ